MAYNKVTYDGKTLIDLTGDTVTPDTLAEGETAHDMSGAVITGTMAAGAPIEHIQVNGEEQEIVDKTVNISIDRASVEDETLIVGDTTGGDSKIVHGAFDDSGFINLTGAGMIILSGDNNNPTIYRFGGKSATMISGSANNYDWDATSDGVEFYDSYGYSGTLYTIIYV